MKNASIINWALLLILGIIWGFSFFFIKRGLVAFDAYQVGALRIFLAFLSVIPIALYLGLKAPKKKLPIIFLSGLLGSAIPPFLFSIAQTKVSSSVTGILNSLTPLFALVFGAILFGIRMKVIHVAGVLIGLIGTVIVIVMQSGDGYNFNVGYGLLIVLGTMFYGTNANVIKSKLHDVHPIQIAIITFLFIGPFAGVYLLTTDFIEVMQTHEYAWNSLIYLIILSSIGTSYALILFNYLAFRTSALFATMVTYIIPLVAVIIGLQDGETITFYHVLGLGLVLAGVYVSSLKGKR